MKDKDMSDIVHKKAIELMKTHGHFVDKTSNGEISKRKYRYNSKKCAEITVEEVLDVLIFIRDEVPELSEISSKYISFYSSVFTELNVGIKNI